MCVLGEGSAGDVPSVGSMLWEWRGMIRRERRGRLEAARLHLPWRGGAVALECA